MPVVVRKDTMAATTSADGEFAFLQVNANGELRITNEVNDAPWECTGFKTADAVVKNAPGTLGGIIVTATDNGGDIDVIVYDSPDSDLTGDIALMRVTITATTNKAQASSGDLAGPGIRASKGLYLDVVAGDCQVLVFYK